ncbi:Fluoroacetate dehalogenase [Thalassoglobus neptunius]|uniref:Fluoroacetate dehalogenase n=2 Tax=Thalassoglobus neptunius TaxID=1938619 RepID=A0A5C5WMT7_9PLAN|nr:Fluoroacetate dehalogenase [Thalassoglobus neptunius]
MKFAWFSSFVLLAIGCSSGESGLSSDRIDIGSHRLEVRVSGDAQAYPAVVIESGLGATVEEWSRVQELLSQKTQVICYNRAGIGGSQPGAEPRDASTISRELRELLLRLQVDPPFVIVGHSIGGIYVRQFAAEHPDEVCGIILLDPTMEFLKPLSRNRIESQLQERWPQDYGRIESLLNRIHPRMSLMAGQSILELEPYFERVPIEQRQQQREVWLDLVTKRARQIEGMLSVLGRAECQELFASAESMDLVRDKAIDVPLLLLAAGKTGSSSASDNPSDNEAMTSDYFLWANDLRIDRYTSFVNSQANGRFKVVPDAGHNIHRDRPRYVAKAIEKMLDTVAKEIAHTEREVLTD